MAITLALWLTAGAGSASGRIEPTSSRSPERIASKWRNTLFEGDSMTVFAVVPAWAAHGSPTHVVAGAVEAGIGGAAACMTAGAGASLETAARLSMRRSIRTARVGTWLARSGAVRAIGATVRVTVGGFTSAIGSAGPRGASSGTCAAGRMTSRLPTATLAGDSPAAAGVAVVGTARATDGCADAESAGGVSVRTAARLDIMRSNRIDAVAASVTGITSTRSTVGSSTSTLGSACTRGASAGTCVSGGGAPRRLPGPMP
ncbi:MAG: hypothetical protein KGK18_05200 [Burkholderiales bacterium]|nr:hypothetical protein [Burkholderiales bacterium]